MNVAQKTVQFYEEVRKYRQKAQDAFPHPMWQRHAFHMLCLARAFENATGLAIPMSDLEVWPKEYVTLEEMEALAKERSII